MLNQKIRKELNRILFWQLIIVMLLSFMFLLIEGIKSGAAFFAGGVSYWIPSYLFIKRVAATAGPRNAPKFMIALLGGETVKLLLSAIIFVMIAVYSDLDAMFMSFGLVTAIFGYVFSSIVIMLTKGKTI